MFKTTYGLIYCSTFNTENDLFTARFYNINHPFPVHYTITAGASNWCTCDLSTFSIALQQADIFGMKVNKPVFNAFEPFVNIRNTCKITIRIRFRQPFEHRMQMKDREVSQTPYLFQALQFPSSLIDLCLILQVCFLDFFFIFVKAH